MKTLFPACIRLLWLVVLVVVGIGLRPVPALAQGAESERLAVILLIDDSGSMKSSDPADIRYTAAQLLVSLLDHGDAAGALRFATASRPITDRIFVLKAAQEKTRLVEALSPAAPEGFTDFKAAFEEAGRMMDRFDRAGFEVVVVLLTDGKPEIPAPYPAYEQEALAAAQRLSAPVVSIALTGAGQSPFLNRLADETGGQVVPAATADDLLDVYLHILGNLKDRTLLFAERDGEGEAFSLDPALAPYVDRVSFVAIHAENAPAALTSPVGQPVDENSPGMLYWLRTPRFSVVSLAAPAGGRWRFEAPRPAQTRARALLFSRLRVRVDSPAGSFEAGQPLAIAVRLTEEAPAQAPVTIIGEVSFAAWITRPNGERESLDRFYDDGTHGDANAGDGVFTREYLNTGLAGSYAIEIRGHKGGVPVERWLQAQAVAFPQLVLDQPAQPSYEIRAESIPLRLRLDGAVVNMLDRGNLVARITTPDGSVDTVTLRDDGAGYTAPYAAAYTAAYRPVLDGEYRVRFETVEAAYQGMPYRRSLEAAFRVRLVPTLVIQRVHLDIPGHAAGGTDRIELEQARQGIPLVIAVSSTSPQAETILAHLEGLPGFTLAGDAVLVVPPRTKSLLKLNLAGSPSQTVGTYTGEVVFSAAGDLDLVDARAPLALVLFEPTLSITPEVTAQPVSGNCLAPGAQRLILSLHSTSLQDERIRLRLDGGLQAGLSPMEVTVKPGTSRVELALLPHDGQGAPGSYTGELVVETARTGVKLAHGARMPLAFQVAPVWQACKRPLIISGYAVFLGGMIIGISILRARRKARPALVTGTLIHWNIAEPNNVASINLTEMRKPAVRLGKGSRNDVMIADESLADEHVVIMAEAVDGQEARLGLQAKAVVRRGYREYSPETIADLPLEENVEYQLGQRVFKYMRDIRF